MDRVFQHYEGVVKELEGKSVSTLLSIEEENGEDVYLLWLHDATEGLWYRIFIDGYYCGMDRFPKNGAANDLDEDLVTIDHTHKLKSGRIQSAVVEPSDAAGRHIVLKLAFSDQIIELICESEEGVNRLVFH